MISRCRERNLLNCIRPVSIRTNRANTIRFHIFVLSIKNCTFEVCFNCLLWVLNRFLCFCRLSQKLSTGIMWQSSPSTSHFCSVCQWTPNAKYARLLNTVRGLLPPKCVDIINSIKTVYCVCAVCRTSKSRLFITSPPFSSSRSRTAETLCVWEPWWCSYTTPLTSCWR